MPKKAISATLALLLFLGATWVNADTEVETPQQGLKAIVELYRAQDWDGLVRQRCLETRHADSEKEVGELIESLSSQFSDEAFLEALVASYEAALAVEPRIEAEGSVAIFASEMGSVKLSKMENGVWGLRF